MRMAFLLTSTIAIAFLVEGCASTRYPVQVASNFIHRQAVVATTKETYAPKNPKTVAIYHDEKKIATPYRIIGIAKVSKYNIIGKEREEAIIHDMMKKLAASIGGDALININTNEDTLQANIIAYQKIMI